MGRWDDVLRVVGQKEVAEITDGIARGPNQEPWERQSGRGLERQRKSEPEPWGSPKGK
jgi:hypothetical protein